MRFSSRLRRCRWCLTPLAAVGLLFWLSYAQVQRVDAVSTLGAEEAVIDPTSRTGYAKNKGWLIVPERLNPSYQWIAETQQMLAEGKWRIRHVDSENAPFGRDVHSASPYHWWLSLVAYGFHAFGSQPMGVSVERAALWADPLLQLLLVIGMTVVVARRWGHLSAAVLAVGMSTMFPFAAGFQPGAPEVLGLMQAAVLGSVLPLVTASAGKLRPSYLISGVIGGLGLWISATHQLPVLIGIAFGGIFHASITRIQSGGKVGLDREPTPWRLWALGGASTCLAAYLIEYFPSHMEMRLQVNHPLYGLAWLGVGELLAQFESLVLRRSTSRPSFRTLLRVILAVGAVAAVPVTLAFNESQSFLAADPLASRLTTQANGAVAKNLATWMIRDGLTGALVATLLPLLLVVPALWLLFRRNLDVPHRGALALGLGPVLVTLILACAQLRWWTTLDSTLLALTVITAAGLSLPFVATRTRQLYFGMIAVIAVIGVAQRVPTGLNQRNLELTHLEAVGLIERSLAHWIAERAGPEGAVVLAPPDLTPGLSFHGGIRGLGTPNWENRDGVSATVRIMSSTTSDEAQALLAQRGVTHLVLPSWDTDLDEFVRWTLAKPENSFLHALQNWAIPPWIRPLAYQPPAFAGLEAGTVTVLQVTDDGDRAASLSRLTEYFLEMQRVDLASAAGEALLPYPSNLGALIARAQLEKARGDSAAFASILNTLLPSVTGALDRSLPWDRRVSLAVVLALGERTDLAQKQLQRCLQESNDERLRSLTPTSLYRLLVLSRTFTLNFPNESTAQLARTLLPAELRERL